LQEFEKDYAGAGIIVRTAIFSNIEEDLQAAQRLVHTVKGMAGNFSAKALFDASLALEKMLQKPSEKQLELLAEFDRELHQVLASISAIKKLNIVQDSGTKAIKNSDSTKDISSLDIDKIVPFINKLAKNIRDNNYQAGQSLLELASHLNGADEELHNELEKLQELINKIQFKSALHSLHSIATRLGVDLKDDMR
jgi:two-component system, sensor histidine kinase and response regulator